MTKPFGAAGTGIWGASFPPFIPQVIGPIRFNPMSESEGRSKMDELRGAGTAANLCPAIGEKTEFYGGEYDYQKRGAFAACTNGSKVFGVYDDYNGLDSGTIQIDMTFPDAMPPRWEGSFTDRQNLRGAMHGVFQGGDNPAPWRVWVTPAHLSRASTAPALYRPTDWRRTPGFPALARR